MLSFWEENSLIRYDAIIVGGGIVGLSTAASLLEANPALRVLVLERGIFPSGASTKNAGFACFGSVSELWNDLEQLGEAGMLELVAFRWEGLNSLIKRLGKNQIGYVSHGGYELLRTAELAYVDKIPTLNRALKPLFDADVFLNRPDHLERFPFSKEFVKGLIYNPFEAQIDTGKMMRSLWSYVQKLGGTVLTGAEFLSWDKFGETFHAQVRNPVSSESLSFKSDILAFCNNAFGSAFFPELDIQPGRGQVLITEPLSGLSIRGVFHMEEGYYYFRNYKDRLLLGGGRNLDFEGESTHEMSTSPHILDALTTLIHEVLLPGQEVKIAKAWAGIMAFGSNKKPIFREVEDRLFVALRLGGMGVAIGSALGERLATQILDASIT